jgi:type II secretory pathway component PulM
MRRYLILLTVVWYRLRSPRYRYLAGVLLVFAIALLFGMAVWLPGERTKLQEQQSRADKAVQGLQSDLAEIDRLKTRTRPTALTGSALHEALVASLGSQLPSLSISQVDADHVRIQGRVPFDSFVRWLGGVQQSHRLGVTSLEVTRGGDGTVVDITLAPNRE